MLRLPGSGCTPCGFGRRLRFLCRHGHFHHLTVCRLRYRLERRIAVHFLRCQVDSTKIMPAFQQPNQQNSREKFAFLSICVSRRRLSGATPTGRIQAYFKVIPFLFINLTSLSAGPCNLFRCSWVWSKFWKDLPHRMLAGRLCRVCNTKCPADSEKVGGLPLSKHPQMKIEWLA